MSAAWALIDSCDWQLRDSHWVGLLLQYFTKFNVTFKVAGRVSRARQATSRTLYLEGLCSKWKRWRQTEASNWLQLNRLVTSHLATSSCVFRLVQTPVGIIYTLLVCCQSVSLVDGSEYYNTHDPQLLLVWMRAVINPKHFVGEVVNKTCRHSYWIHSKWKSVFSSALTRR